MVVHGLETLKHLTEEIKHNNPVFIMAGGFGTRLRPLTDETPKPMLKVGAKPILERIIESFVKAGFHEFYISIHYKADMVRDYFGSGEKWGVDITYIREDEPLGTAGALKLLPDSMSDLPIILMNGDILTNVNYRNLLEFHEENASTATVCVKEYDIQVPYGVVEGNDYLVTEIVEKPVQRFLVNAGIYVLDQSILSQRNNTGYLEMPSLLDGLIKSDKKVTMFPIHEYWIDIGQMEEYERAQEEVQWVL
jgi:NDP-sugar pyrophosphorylase family protein